MSAERVAGQEDGRLCGPGHADDGLRRWATYASVGVALSLIVLKVVGYVLTGSVSLLSSLLDSATDLMASLVTLLGVRIALTPPDRAHRFGHGKAEPLAALAQAAFVLGSAAFLVIEAVHRLIDPRPIEQGEIGIAILVIAMLLTLGLVLFQRHVVRRTGSVAIGADRLHYVGDLLTNALIIGALLLTDLTGWTRIDPLVAFLIAGLLVRGAVGIAITSLNMLMDHELPEAERERIVGLVLKHPRCRGLHDLRTRQDGSGRFVELHLEVDGALSLKTAHDIAHEIEDAIRIAFPDAAVLIHQEPAGLEDDRLDHRIGAAAQAEG